MSSDSILFDSAEFTAQEKENKSDNELIHQSIDSRQSEKQAEESSQDDSLNKLLELEANDNETQSSQDILDKIALNVKNITERGSSTAPSLHKPEPNLLDSLDTEDNGQRMLVLEKSNISEPIEAFQILEKGSEGKNISTVSPGLNESEANIFDSLDTVNDGQNELDTDQLSEPMEASVKESSRIEEAGSGEIDNKSEKAEDNTNTTSIVKASATKHCMLPLSRVKLIMKTDPNVKVVSSEATIVAAIAAENFIKFIVQETLRITKSKKKKTMLKQHFDEAIQGLDVTEFLQGMMDDDL